MKIKITKQVEAKECTEQFVSKLYGFLEDHVIVKIDENEYAIVNKENNISLVQFQSVEKITNVIWILNINDKEKRLIDISKSTPKLSDPFSKVIKTFEEYMLVELKDGDRLLLEFSEIATNSSTLFACPYCVFELPNGKYTIVDMDDLTVANFEFELKYGDFN